MALNINDTKNLSYVLCD